MPFSSSLQTIPNTLQAVNKAVAHALANLGGLPDLALVFFSPHHAPAGPALAERLQDLLGPCCLLGCQGEAIVGDSHEVEDGPALSLWLAKWTKPVEQTPFHLTLEETSDGHSLLGWPDDLQHAIPAEAAMLVLGDPFSFPADGFLGQINEDCPGLRVMGGMSSGGQAPGEAALVLGSQVLSQGASASCCRAIWVSAAWYRRAAGPSASTWLSPGLATTSSPSLAASPPWRSFRSYGSSCRRRIRLWCGMVCTSAACSASTSLSFCAAIS